MSDSPQSVFKLSLLPLWVGLALTMALPFLSLIRTGPQSAFFLEAMSLLGVLVWFTATAAAGKLKSAPPAATWWLLLLAVFWAAQARLMKLDYVGLSDMVAWTFVVLAFGVWTCRAWVRDAGQERAAAVLAWVLVAACCLQAAVGWLQYTGHAAHFKPWLMYRAGIVEGQLGQRNHFGHYLMWGALAAAYLWTARRMAWWGALAVWCWLGGAMALTGSRSVLAYFIALAVLALLWRLWAGAAAKRAVRIVALALAVLAVLQFALEPLLQLFGSGSVESAAERLGNHSFGQSGRDYESRKAWQIFQTAPWFGHGWGSYALQGFLADPAVYAKGFRQYDQNVLFTHSHNGVLNLLAEMGAVGTGLVFGGLAWCVRTAFVRKNAASLFLLAAMSVSLVHSLLEYPLWYVYFLTAFTVFVGMMPAPQRETRALAAGWFWAAVAAAIIVIFGIVRLGVAYNDLRHAASGSRDAVAKSEKIVKLLYLARTEPMWRYYAHMNLLNHVDTAADHLPAWAQEARLSAHYRPYANAHKWALLAYRAGEREAAADWLRQMYRYYPTKYPVYGAALMTPPHYAGLRAQFSAECRAYYAAVRQTPVCAEAMPPKPQGKP
ncbi:PglL family O-oligosaccharyltransferase [Conchiformibius kuhniae]|uniref:Wzy polymerase domain-containing protein n=1 Tax=Conchiformibius kuhniae TaxID=211502 RepID=A0A8T9MVT4_9NEIS|nr:PglL family O-oligosaccharyltransferase [Conchiformibius kuhniae]